MCGIVGYSGKRQCFPILMNGLTTLEYRGYDSAGLAIMVEERVSLVKREGKLQNLRDAFSTAPVSGTTGIGHTRWATHGEPNQTNAHPHKSGAVTVVHNGIIENYRPLRAQLQEKGHTFTSNTDTEILAHLMDDALNAGSTPLEALFSTLSLVEGTWSIALLIDGAPQTIWVAKKGSPLLLGTKEEEIFVASDIPALLSHTREMIFLQDGDVAELTPTHYTIYGSNQERVERPSERILWNPIMAEKGGYKHFMLKEIFEQPRAIADTIGERVDRTHLKVDFTEFCFDPKTYNRLFIVACGTSFYAGLIGKYLIEGIAGLPVEVDMGSEFRYRSPLIGPRDLCIVLSQSGETADTLAALDLAKKRGATVLGIVNVLGSAIARRADYTLYTHAGPEIGVASTKAFTAQLVLLSLLATHMGTATHSLDQTTLSELLEEMLKLPGHLNAILAQSAQLHVIARRYATAKAFLFIARGINYPIALEGALKLKEISYVHAEGYPAGEMKHGPIALIDDQLPVLAVAPQGPHMEKMLSNIEEVKSRRGKVIGITTAGEQHLGTLVDDLIMLPSTHPMLQPLLTVVPLQLFAYYTADLKGTDIDQPRNLAKSVTVE